MEYTLAKYVLNVLARESFQSAIECINKLTERYLKIGKNIHLRHLSFDCVKLIKRGKRFSLGLNFDRHGPQKGTWGNRFNPIHLMLATGTDAVAGRFDEFGLRYADDMISLPLQCATQWDALAHIFYDDYMWNGYDARLVDSDGAQKNGIEKVRAEMAGRGVLLDVARWAGVDFFEDGVAISANDLDECAKSQNVDIKQGDFVIVRTGQMEQRLDAGDWDWCPVHKDTPRQFECTKKISPKAVIKGITRKIS